MQQGTHLSYFHFWNLKNFLDALKFQHSHIIIIPYWLDLEYYFHQIRQTEAKVNLLGSTHDPNKTSNFLMKPVNAVRIGVCTLRMDFMQF